jgi:hypothetical protein
MGPTSIKTYDKLGIALRIETTSNDVTFFKHFRDVKQADGSIVNKIASTRKSIYRITYLNLSHIIFQGDIQTGILAS